VLTLSQVRSGDVTVVGPLTKRLLDELSAGKRVLWLVCGGSNIPLSVAVMKTIPLELREKLTIMLTDERYGKYDHPDSNTRQLREAGFDASGATVKFVLTPENMPLEVTCRQYASALEEAFMLADLVIAQFGIGPDGHIAGMLPHSPAVTSSELIVGYDAGNFVRITMTPVAFKSIQAAYAFVFGDSKREALQNLLAGQLTLDEEPAQILKQLPEAFVYNDQVEGEVA